MKATDPGYVFAFDRAATGRTSFSAVCVSDTRATFVYVRPSRFARP